MAYLSTLLLTGCAPRQAEENPASSHQGTLAVDPATTGTISGKLRLEGERPQLAQIRMDQDPVCTAKHREPVPAEDGAVNPDGSLPDVFVYAKSGAEKYSFAAPSTPVTLDQDGCVYKPHVFGLMVGQTLRIVSSDATTHNIHAVARANRQWNESQLPGAAPINKVFTRPEVMIPIKCNEHPWMKAYAGVVSNPFFAVTGEDGSYTLKGLPTGNYTIEAWTASFGTQDQKVTVTARSTTKLDFTFKR
jgi:plastocyanin